MPVGRRCLPHRMRIHAATAWTPPVRAASHRSNRARELHSNSRRDARPAESTWSLQVTSQWYDRSALRRKAPQPRWRSDIFRSLSPQAGERAVTQKRDARTWVESSSALTQSCVRTPRKSPANQRNGAGFRFEFTESFSSFAIARAVPIRHFEGRSNRALTLMSSIEIVSG